MDANHTVALHRRASWAWVLSLLSVVTGLINTWIITAIFNGHIGWYWGLLLCVAGLGMAATSYKIVWQHPQFPLRRVVRDQCLLGLLVHGGLIAFVLYVYWLIGAMPRANMY